MTIYFVKRLISYKHAIQLAQFIFGLFIIFHLSVIMGILLFEFVPLNFLWGGRLETREELLVFEFVSLIVMTLCYLIILIKSEKVFLPGMSGVASIALWILFGLFLLNTIGNILAKTTFEKLFAIVTATLAILCLRISLENKQSK